MDKETTFKKIGLLPRDLFLDVGKISLTVFLPGEPDRWSEIEVDPQVIKKAISREIASVEAIKDILEQLFLKGISK